MKSLFTRRRHALPSMSIKSSADKRLERIERRALLQAVERLRVAFQNLLRLGVADPALIRPAADFVERAQVGADVGAAVVGADHQ